jgi:hypothetical protein
MIPEFARRFAEIEESFPEFQGMMAEFLRVPAEI